MIKALLGTAAAVGLVFFTLGSGPAYGEVLTSGAIPPSLTINGFTAINSYFVNQQRRDGGKGGPQPHIGVDASNLFFTIMGASASGLEYQYRITFETIPGSGSTIDQNFIQLKGNMGTFQFGNLDGCEDTQVFDASKIIGGTGGFDGGYNNVYNMSAGIVRGNDNIGDTGKATKVVYYTPELMGFQFGITYTPNTAHKGDEKLDTPMNYTNRFPGNRGIYDYKGLQPFDLRSVALGATYKAEKGKWSMTLSGVGITAKSYLSQPYLVIGNQVSSGRVALQNTKAYQLGFIVGYGDFRFGAGYLDNGNSRLPKQNLSFGSSASSVVNLGSMYTGNAGYGCNVGAGYTMGAYQFGVSYQRTNRNTGNALKAHSDFYSATVDVTPLQGLKVYTEVDYIRSRSNDDAVNREAQFIAASSTKARTAIKNNAGALLIVGTKVSF